MPEDAVRQRRVEEAHERMRRRLRPERPAPGPAAREEQTENDELYVGGPHVSLPRAGSPDGGDEAQRFLATVHVAARLHPRLDHAEAILRVQARRGKCNTMGHGHSSPGAALDCAKYASATQISARRSR